MFVIQMFIFNFSFEDESFLNPIDENLWVMLHAFLDTINIILNT